MKPNKPNILKWVKALESGDFRQTIGQLRKNGDYCCLGVACSISRLRGWKGTDAQLPQKVADWLGLSANPCLGNFNYKPIFAAEANDAQNWDFIKIASKLRKRYLSKKVK